MSYKVIYISLILFLIGCKSPEQEVLDLNDIIAQSENYQEDSLKIEVPETVAYTPQLDSLLLLENAIRIENCSLSDTLLFPDRYTPKSKELFYYKIDSDSLLFAEYTFKSNDYATSVLQNWINCFGDNCKTIPYASEGRIAPLPFLLMQTDHRIIYIYNCPKAEQEKWINYFITEKSNGKLIQQFTKYKSGWSVIVDGEIQPIENTENESL